MTLRHMKIFVIVCQENSITQASKKLFISQPAISGAIKEMEDYYGVKLFDRISKKIYLTEVGKTVLDYALHITSMFEELETKVRNSDTIGSLRIGSSITIGNQLMPKYIKHFSEKFPDIQTYVTINSSDIIEDLILSNELDIGLIEGLVHSDNIISKCFLKDELIVICDINNPLLEKEEITIKDLKTQRFIMREKNSGTRELVESLLLLHGLTIVPIWESTSTAAIINGVSDGIGISVLPHILAENHMKENRIKRLHIKDLNLQRELYIIYHKKKFLTKTSMEFINMCMEDTQIQ
ncbi:LysR family transcriptional regulator [Anaerocolumna aminovalerica]|uniref:DNA-binding transcriptional regulator, LysR family n=1 Tax=Anaerocolumna aminovalerica TaxID=1527 RepID=A0A1I5HXI4_9FIRM|nr:LysR family transcriptional regulator [Anaerocolumna aminovalerica]SFO52616.1 DNA-binding transcriptional regulator, LysR family [Anaerocolumna aminovalerica]